MKLQVNPIPAFNDNYIWIVHDDQNALIVDPGSAEPVEKYLAKHNLKLNTVIITHHHWDHINGVQDLVNNWDCEVYGPKDERISCLSKVVQEGDTISDLAINMDLHVIETPGHTLSHICYHNDQLLFCGDTLFSLGCGRMFEGTAEQFVSSLNKIKKLKKETIIYCTHEYTQSNIDFALSIEPNNTDILSKKVQAHNLRNSNLPTIPVTLNDELKCNPFLRTDDTQYQAYLSTRFNQDLNSETKCFAYLRTAKDKF